MSHIERFREAVEDRIVPSFETIDAEAEAHSTEFWQSEGRQASPEVDPADLAERAMEAGIDRFTELVNVLQTFLNMSAVALHHLLEQQLVIVTREVVDRAKRGALKNREEIISLLKEHGIDPTTSESWGELEVLRHAANAIKHGEGSSARVLRELRPALFLPPIVRGMKNGLLPSLPAQVEDPLAGHHIYINEEDLGGFFDAVEEFWDDLRADLL